MILTWELRYSQKRGVNRKRRGEFWKFFCLGGGKWLTLGKEEFVWGTRGRGKLYRLIIKWTSFKTVVKDFPYTLRVPSTDCFKSIASHKKCIFLKNELLFGSLFSVMRCNSSVLFLLKLFMVWTKGAYQSTNFQTSDCSRKYYSNSLYYFSNHQSIFL